VLGRHGIRTIGDLARANRRQIIGLLGKAGGSLWDCANGLDESPIVPPEQQPPVKSVGNSITFRRNLTGLTDIRAGLLMLADSVAARLRAEGLRCASVQVQIKDPNLKVISRQKPLPFPTNLTDDIFEASLALVRSSWALDAPIRMLSVTGIHLVDSRQGEQLSLLDEPRQDERREKLARALDDIRGRFGWDAVSVGSLMVTDIVAHPGQGPRGHGGPGDGEA
jgi:DNA polymerase-4